MVYNRTKPPMGGTIARSPPMGFTMQRYAISRHLPNFFALFFTIYHNLCHILGVVDCGSLERERGEAAASTHAKP